MDQSLEEFDADLILRCCELYGRFSIHRANSEGKTEFGSEISSICDWTTQHVLPALLRNPAEGSGFQSLDLSRISTVSDSSTLQASPGFKSPPKQRLNLGRLSTGSTSSKQKLSLVDNASVVLLQSACLVLCEFLWVGGEYSDAIGMHIAKWSAVFACSDAEDERSRHLKSQLLQSFVHLGVVLFKRVPEKTAMLKELMVNCEKSAVLGSEDVLVQATKTLLNGKQKADSKVVENLVEMVLSACGQLLPQNEPSSFSVASSSSEVALWSGEVVTSVLEVVAQNGRACKSLSEKVLAKILSHRGEVDNAAIFYARCLSFLIPILGSEVFNEKFVDEMKEERPEFEGMLSMMEKIVYVTN